MAGARRVLFNVAAVDIELWVYKAALSLVIIPAFCLFTPVYFLQEAVVDGYRLCRRIAALGWGVTLEPVEEIRFEGHAFFIAAGAIMLAATVGFLAVLWLRLRRPPESRTLPDVAQARRYRPPPAVLRDRLEAKISGLWRIMSASDQTVPASLCFASTGVAACVVERPSGPAIAVSTALLEQLDQPDTLTVDVILLHEMAHLVGRDPAFFRFCAAFVRTFRQAFTSFIIAVGVIAVVSSAFELLNVAGIEQRSPSIYAFAIDDIRDLLFPYASMILVLRYIGLTIILTELRADLRAARAVGGLDRFASGVRSDPGMRFSPPGYFWRTITGTRVTHLAAVERLVLMEDTTRLLTPKYRYFGWSLVLSLLLLLDGSVAFTGFETGLQVGIIATIAAVNAVTVAMMIGIDRRPVRRGQPQRLAVMTVVIIAANILLLFNPSDVMGETSEVFTALFNPAVHERPDQVHQTLLNWLGACGGPIGEAARDGRLELWLLAVFAGLFLFAAWVCWFNVDPDRPDRGPSDCDGHRCDRRRRAVRQLRLAP